jgi:hypothetical protein
MRLSDHAIFAAIRRASSCVSISQPFWSRTTKQASNSSTDQGSGKRRGWALRSITSEPGAK